MISRPNTSQIRQPRAGAATLEMLTAGVLLATVMTFIVPFVGRIAIVNEEIADREFALREVQNIIVRLQQGETELKLSSTAQSRLEEATLSIESTPLPKTKLVSTVVSLSWVNHFGERVSPSSLTCWTSEKEQP